MSESVENTIDLNAEWLTKEKESLVCARVIKANRGKIFSTKTFMITIWSEVINHIVNTQLYTHRHRDRNLWHFRKTNMPPLRTRATHQLEVMRCHYLALKIDG